MLACVASEPEYPVALERELERKIARNELELPVLSEVAQRVLAMASKDDCDLAKLTETLRGDPSLAGRLLEIANSTAYAARARIVSLQQAVSRLGKNTIRDIAVIISSQSRVFESRTAEPLVVGVFRHSVCTAVFAQEIARMRRANVEEAFLSGLLHDVGRPVLVQAIADIQRHLGCGCSASGLERLLDTHHGEVGGQLAGRWNLSPATQGAIRWHHDAISPPQHDGPLTVALADAFAHVVQDGADLATVTEHPALEPLNLYPEEVDDLLSRRGEILGKAEALS